MLPPRSLTSSRGCSFTQFVKPIGCLIFRPYSYTVYRVYGHQKEIYWVIYTEKGNRELKQRGRRRLWKRHLKSEFALLQTLSRLFHLVSFVKCGQIVFELHSEGLFQRSVKEKESCCLLFPPSTKREIRHFHVAVVQWQLKEMFKKGWGTCKVVVLLI